MKKLALLVLFISTVASAAKFHTGQAVVLSLSNSHYDVRISELYSDDTALIRYEDGATQVVPLSLFQHQLPVNEISMRGAPGQNWGL